MPKKVIRFVPVLLWMCFIFLLSSLQTSGIHGTSQERFIILKSFHLIEYAILYALMFFGARKPIPSFGMGYLYAISDEVHQSFVPGRTAAFRDTLIDLLGMIIGFALLWVFSRTTLYKKIFA